MAAMHPSRSLFQISDLSPGDIGRILDRADRLRRSARPPRTLDGKAVGLLFMEPSVRTQVGFQAAVAKLGGSAIIIPNSRYKEGMSRDESLSDTLRVVSAYCDALVVRHPSTDLLWSATRGLPGSMINAGSGHEHHPTQSLIDLYAIRRLVGRLRGLRIGLAGNLRDSRAAKSLAGVLAGYAPREIRQMAPRGLALPSALLKPLVGARVSTLSRIEPEGLDVLYMAGLPPGMGKGRLSARSRHAFRLTPAIAERLPARGVVLSPLPRIDEIDLAVDSMPQAGYFHQSAEGLYVRMAVLEFSLGQMS